MLRLFLVLSFFQFGVQILQAQDSLVTEASQEIILDDRDDLQPLNWDEGQLQEFKEDSDYDYTEQQPQDNWLSRFRTWLGRMWDSFWRWLLGDGEISGFWLFIIQALPYLIIAGVLFFVIWLLIKLNPGSKLLANPRSPEVLLSDDEQLIREADLSGLIDQAIANKEYRLALRYYYLQVLRGLGHAGWIDYESDKTNSDYSKELRKRSIHPGFNQATRWYEYIWYGEFGIDENQFRQAEILFQDLNHQIDQAHE